MSSTYELAVTVRTLPKHESVLLGGVELLVELTMPPWSPKRCVVLCAERHYTADRESHHVIVETSTGLLVAVLTPAIGYGGYDYGIYNVATWSNEGIALPLGTRVRLDGLEDGLGELFRSYLAGVDRPHAEWLCRDEREPAPDVAP